MVNITDVSEELATSFFRVEAFDRDNYSSSDLKKVAVGYPELSMISIRLRGLQHIGTSADLTILTK
jgi:hypothetical protein